MRRDRLRPKNPPTDAQIDRAIDYNRRRDTGPFLCQSTWRTIDLETAEGVEWTWAQQELLDLVVDGMFGPNTEKAYTKRFGELSTEAHTRAPAPVFEVLWGYDHAHVPGNVDWPKVVPSWERFLKPRSWTNGMLRLVCGYRPKYRTFSRWPTSVISLDTISIGFPHFWAMTIPEHIGKLVDSSPCLASRAFGPQLTATLSDPEKCREFFQTDGEFAKGKMPMRFELLEFVVGWRRFMLNAEPMRGHADEWLQHYVESALKECRDQGWSDALKSQDGGRILAAVTRLRNSGALSKIKTGRRIAKTRDPMRVLAATYKTRDSVGGYGEPERWERITTWPDFDGPAPSLSDLHAGR